MILVMPKQGAMFGCLLSIAVLAGGCGSQGSGGAPAQVSASSHDGQDHESDPTHNGWWCVEHGVPEKQCAMCDSKLATQLREKGDWCQEHARPESLCFQCDPTRADKFVALYEAKYGKMPPQPTD